MEPVETGLLEQSQSKYTELTAHINQGIDLMVQGKGNEAFTYFRYNPEKEKLLGIKVKLGSFMPIRQLLSEEDLVEAASSVANNSKIHGPDELEIGDWEMKKDHPELYDQALVQRFYQEISIVAAEEWLHVLQEQMNSSLTEEKNPEVDVAAYLDQKSVFLSADFLTRYEPRAAWYIKKYPERAQGILEFDKKYKRGVERYLRLESENKS